MADENATPGKSANSDAALQQLVDLADAKSTEDEADDAVSLTSPESTNETPDLTRANIHYGAEAGGEAAAADDQPGTTASTQVSGAPGTAGSPGQPADTQPPDIAGPAAADSAAAESTALPAAATGAAQRAAQTDVATLDTAQSEAIGIEAAGDVVSPAPATASPADAISAPGVAAATAPETPFIDGQPAPGEAAAEVVDSTAEQPALELADGAGSENQAIALSIITALVDTDGSESLSITISDVPAGATLSAGSDNGDGSWTLTPAQLSGLTITPPADSDTDFSLTVTATSTEASGGDTAVASGSIAVNVAADADAPSLTLQAASGIEDTAISLNITSALTDTDGSETLSITISDVPSGASLSAGSDNGEGSWTLTPGQLSGLNITPPASSDTDFSLTVSATSTEASGGDTAVASGTVAVSVAADADTPSLTLAPAAGNEDTAIPLGITTGLADTDGSETLSITISDVPAGATLSAGSDNGDGSWTLTPAQLSGLTITPPAGSGDDFTLSVTTTATEASGGDTAVSSGTIAVAVNDAPEASDSQAAMARGTPISGALGASDSDDSRSDLSYAVDSGPANGALTINADGSFTYTPNSGFEGTDSFTYQVTDPGGLSDSATVSVNVLEKSFDHAGASEFQVNTTTAGNQERSSADALADGGFVVTWQSKDQDGDGQGIFGQRYDADGNAQGGEFQVNTTTADNQERPSVVGLDGGDIVMVWQSKGDDGDGKAVIGQRFDENGDKIGGEFTVNTFTTGDQKEPAITSLADGGFVVSWESKNQDGDGSGIYGQRYDANGDAAGAEFQINTTITSDQKGASVDSLGDGGFVVSWQNKISKGDEDVFAQRFDADGNKIGAEFQVNSFTAGNQKESVVTALTGGGFVITWKSKDQDGDKEGVFGQRYDSDGTALGSEFQINTTTADDQKEASVTALETGGFFVTWTSTDQDGNGKGVYGQQYDADGDKVGGEILINDTTSLDQSRPDVLALEDGSLVVSWTDAGLDGDDKGIFAEHITLDSSGAYTLSGGDGDDSFIAGSQGDTISGGSGNDTLAGGAGADTIDGGTGTDMASFAGSEAGVNVNLATGVASGGDAAGDVLSNIENLTGSDFADSLTGDSAANQLSGGLGNDTITGGGGNDVMQGGDGDDSFILGAGDGNDSIDGGTGGAWTDTVDLDNPGDFGTDWTINLDPGSTIANQTANSLDLSDDASGTINLSDGSEISFEGIERFDW